MTTLSKKQRFFHFGEELKKIRKELGFNIKEMGKIYGLRHDVNSHYEKGRRIPQSVVFQRILVQLDDEQQTRLLDAYKKDKTRIPKKVFAVEVKPVSAALPEKGRFDIVDNNAEDISDIGKMEKEQLIKEIIAHKKKEAMRTGKKIVCCKDMKKEHYGGLIGYDEQLRLYYLNTGSSGSVIRFCPFCGFDFGV